MTKEQLENKVKLLEEQLSKMKLEVVQQRQRGNVYLEMLKAGIKEVDK
jgi:hypothetical protein